MPSWFIDGKGDLNGSFNYTWAKCMSTQCKISTIAIFENDDDELKWELDQLNENAMVWRLWVPKKWNKLRRIFAKSAAIFKKAREINLQNKVDLVHNSVVWNLGLLAWRVSLNLKVPFYITEHSSDYVDKYQAAYKRKIAFGIMRRAKGVMVVSEILRELCLKNGVERVTQMPNFINEEIDAIRINRNSQYTFVHVTSSDIRRKGTIAMLEVYKQVKKEVNVKLLIVADKLDKTAVGLDDELCNRLDIVWQNSLKSEKDYYKKIAQAHCYINFSVTETFAIVVVEAVRLGMHVIYTRSGGPEQYMNAELGTEIAVNDAIALKNEMIKAAMTCKIQDKSRDELKNFFGTAQIVERHLNLYNG